MAKAGKCECNWFMMVIGVIVMAIGVFLFVKGFIAQTQSYALWMILAYYAAGILVWAIGKMLKCKGCCGHCSGMMMGK